MGPPVYDQIGATYCATRRADPAILNALADLVGVRDSGTFLDLACGAGNYTAGLAERGGTWHGVDISMTMLRQAAERSPLVAWSHGSADALPYGRGRFDGVVCSLAIHHFPDLSRAFNEVSRVLASGRFVIFTAFPGQMRNYWLCEYFPEMMERACRQMPDESAVENALVDAGLELESIVPYDVPGDLEDLFLYAGKWRPQLYLDAGVRANISSFAMQCPEGELVLGLERLQRDLESGTFGSRGGEGGSQCGDYAYVIARKS